MKNESENDNAAIDEERCRIAGDLIERGLSQVHPLLTAAQHERLQQALMAPRTPASGWRRRGLLPAIVTSAALAAVGMLLLRSRPLGFEVAGGAVGEGGWVETGAAQRAQVRFSDGTSIALAEASAGRVSARTSAGATFTVDRGGARFDVVHRARTHWLVEAGPFEIAVTGTRFDVSWSAARGHALTVDLHAGSVVVRGALAGKGISLHAGQRLMADLDRGTMVVQEEEAPAGQAPAEQAHAEQAYAGQTPAERAEDGPTESDPAARARLENGAGVGRVGDDSAGDRAARADRTRGARSSTAAMELVEPGSGAEGPPGTPAIPGLSPSPAPGPAPQGTPGRALLEPEPWHPPPLPADTRLAAGGAACLGWAPQVRFDRSIEGVAVASAFSLAFSHPVLDRNRSWCGSGSLRVDARFDLSGAPNRFGDRPRHSGEALIALPAPVDLTDRTVTVHFFVEGPPDIHFGAQLFAVNRPPTGEPKWVGGGFTPDLTTGRWWTVSHTFQPQNRLFEGGTSPADQVGALTLQVYAIGKDRVWVGRVFVDDIGWQ